MSLFTFSPIHIPAPNSREAALCARRDLRRLSPPPAHEGEEGTWQHHVNISNSCNLCSNIQHPCLNQVGYDAEAVNSGTEGKVVFYICDDCWTIMFDNATPDTHRPYDLSDEEATKVRSDWRAIANRVTPHLVGKYRVLVTQLTSALPPLTLSLRSGISLTTSTNKMTSVGYPFEGER